MKGVATNRNSDGYGRTISQICQIVAEGIRTLAHLGANGWIILAGQWILKKYT
jgi:hypothetical protein